MGASVRLKKTFKKVLGGATISKSILEAGYAPSVAKTTGKITRQKAWKDLMNKHLSDASLTLRHRQLLMKNERDEVYDPITKTRTLVDTGIPDTLAVGKALDMAYKLKGRYDDGTHIDQRSVTINISGDKAERLLRRSELNRATPPSSEA